MILPCGAVEDAALSGAAPHHEVDLTVAAEPNDYDEPLRWLATWLHAGQEGDIIAGGRGGGAVRGTAPTGAVGVRIRRWYSDGVAPEYDDHLFPGIAAGQPQ